MINRGGEQRLLPHLSQRGGCGIIEDDQIRPDDESQDFFVMADSPH